MGSFIFSRSTIDRIFLHEYLYFFSAHYKTQEYFELIILEVIENALQVLSGKN